MNICVSNQIFSGDLLYTVLHQLFKVQIRDVFFVDTLVSHTYYFLCLKNTMCVFENSSNV